MKKVILSLAIATSALVISCQKTQIAPNSGTTANSSTTTTASPASNARQGGSTYRILFLSNDLKYCVCVSSGGNCLPDVVVTPKSVADKVISNVIAEVNAGNQANVQQIFADNRDVLNDVIDNSDVVRVINGNLTVSTANGYDGNTRFLIFRKAKTNEIEVGYPFVY